MKRLLSNIRIWIIPLLLCIALLVTGVMSVQSNSSLEGNARVINYTGIVRGATQRLIKKELNHTPDDALIQRLDDILDGLCNSSEEYDLVRIDDEHYHT
ncbi:MAG: diguanylate cyclase, partial [[Clostridium] innocuum]